MLGNDTRAPACVPTCARLPTNCRCQGLPRPAQPIWAGVRSLLLPSGLAYPCVFGCSVVLLLPRWGAVTAWLPLKAAAHT